MELTTGGCPWRREDYMSGTIDLVVRQCFCACVDVNCLSSARRGTCCLCYPRCCRSAAQGAPVEPLAVNTHWSFAGQAPVLLKAWRPRRRNC